MFKKRPNILNHCVYISASAIWLLYHWVKIGTFSFPSTLESQNIISPLAPSWFPLSFRQIRAYIARRSVNEGAGGITPPPPSHLKKGHTPLPPLPPSLSLQADISIFYMIKLPSNLSFFLQTRYNGGPASFTCVSSHVPISRAHINIILYTQLSPFLQEKTSSAGSKDFFSGSIGRDYIVIKYCFVYFFIYVSAELNFSCDIRTFNPVVYWLWWI